ncbi:MAG: hypothetical protein NTU61_03630 [Candidatus Altiarchaeota archaeon]|nr:hypothetical protein [Candidatus Altiarchaeota archaeon]
MDEDQREEWRRIGEREMMRRKNLEQLRGMMEGGIKEDKTPKSLLRLILHGEGITINDAANMLSVSRETVIKWALQLRANKLVEVIGAKTTNPTLKPTNDLIAKLLSYKRRRESGYKSEDVHESLENLEKKKEELLKERENRIQLGEEVERKAEDLRLKDKEFEREHNLRMGLEEQLAKMEGQLRGGGGGAEIGELRSQLDRERKERRRVEELLKIERDDIRKTMDEMSNKYIQKEKDLTNRETMLIEKEKSLAEDEELEILFGGDAEYDKLLLKSKKILTLIKEKLVEMKDQPLEAKYADELDEVIEEEDELSDMLKDEANLLREKRKQLEKAGSQKPPPKDEAPKTIPIEDVRGGIYNVNDLVQLLGKNKTVRLKDAARILGVEERTVNGWAAELVKKNVAEVRKHITGGDELLLLDKTDTRKVKDEIEREELEEELKRVMQEEKEIK